MTAGILGLALLWAAAVPTDMAAIRAHVAHGRVDEALEALDALSDEQQQQTETILWRVRSLELSGDTAKALKILQARLSQAEPPAELYAEQARLLAARGELVAAGKAAEAALAINADQPLARLVQADVWTETGDLKRASEGYRWFVRFYNRAQPEDADTLLLIGQGAAQYARWKSVSQIFDFIVNTVCVDSLAADADCWQAHQLAGELLLEKYNEADGIPELQAALAINPHAPEVHVTLAENALDDMQYDTARDHIERVLSRQPQHPEALRLRAKMLILQGQLDEAERAVKAALESCPTHQRTLALAAFLETLRGPELKLERLQQLWASLETIDQWDAGDSAFEQVVVRLARVNPRPGYFLQELGRLFEGQRKFRYAEACYTQAIAKMPQLSQPKNELGMLLFQAGRMEEAGQLLDAAFQADPYHVRISNMRKVLRVLKDYGTTATDHFVIRADSQLDSVLARYMAEELERVYADVTTEYGFEPPQRTQIEIYNQARGLAGHQWFSARMIGLPWLQTIGASTGLIIALTSPSATDEPFNWARVIRHEFVHVVTLQQTDFNIPHWFTEALATRAEGYPPPKHWNDLLLKRLASGDLKNLDNLHLGFQRAESREDWDFAYCQSVLYAEYFLERFGPDALRKLLDAYRGTRSTDVALKQAYGVEKADVEAGYLEFLKRKAATLTPSLAAATFDEEAITTRYEADPQNVTHQAEYAQLLLRQRKFDEAAELAGTVLKTDPQQVLAATVLAQVHLVQKDDAAALKVLQAAYQPDIPDARLWLMLGQLLLKQDQAAEAQEIFRRGTTRWEADVTWWEGLSLAAEKAEDTATWKTALERIAALDAEAAGARLQRAELALAEQDYPTAVRYGKLALQIDVLNVDVHLVLARGLLKTGEQAAALAEFDVALQLTPGDAEIQAERDAARQQKSAP